MSKKRTLQMVLCSVMLLSLPLSSCKHLGALANQLFKKPTMRYKAMRLNNVSLQGLGMDFDFLVKNSNPVGVTFANIGYQLFVDNSLLFRDNGSPRNMELKANGESKISVPFKVEFKKFIKAMASLFSKRDRLPYRLKVNFGIKTPLGVLSYPFDLKGMVPIPQAPAVSLRSVKLTKFSLFSGAQLNFQVAMKHRGKFPVKVQGMNYDIRVGGVNVLTGKTQATPMQAGKEQLINIPVNLQIAKVGLAAIKALQGGSLNFNFNGALDMGAFKVPLNFGPKDTRFVK